MRLRHMAPLMAVLSTPAHADTSACWWMPDDPSHPELSCVALTPALMMSLEGASKAAVVSAMGAPGWPDAHHILRYESNYAYRRRGYSGSVTFTFTAGGNVEVIDAAVDAPHHRRGMKFIWNAQVPGCSDFPGSIQRCDNLQGAPRPAEPPAPVSDPAPHGWLIGWLHRHLFTEN